MLDRMKALFGTTKANAPEVEIVEPPTSAPPRRGPGLKLSVYAEPDSPVQVPAGTLVHRLLAWSHTDPPVALVSVDGDGHEVDVVLSAHGITYVYRPTLEDRALIRSAPDRIVTIHNARFVPWDDIGKVVMEP